MADWCRMLRAYIWFGIAARLASDQALRDEAVRGRDRLEQKIALPEIEAARVAAGSWIPGGPDPDEGVAAPRQMTSRPPGGERLSSGGSGRQPGRGCPHQPTCCRRLSPGARAAQ